MNLTKYKFKKGLKLNGENLENKSNFKKLNLRNYDENPIVICDKTIDCIKFSIIIQIVIILIPCIIKFIVTGEFARSIYMTFFVIARLRSDIKQDYLNAKIYFYNAKICKQVNGEIYSEIDTNKVSKILKTINYSIPHNYTLDILGTKSAIAFLLILFVGIFVKFGILTSLFFVGLILFLILLPQIIYHLNKNIDPLFDMLFIKDKNNNCLNFMISYESEYKELKQYFQIKTGKNLDKVEKKITALFEFNKQDFE